jgi:hypothetical protein
MLACWTRCAQAHAQARERFWARHGAPEQVTIDVAATLINSHSEKEKAAGTRKGGFGFHPLQAYLDETREALGGILRPGNAGANTAADHQVVLDMALAQLPPHTSQRSRSWSGQTPPGPPMTWSTTARRPGCASRSGKT